VPQQPTLIIGRLFDVSSINQSINFPTTWLHAMNPAQLDVSLSASILLYNLNALLSFVQLCSWFSLVAASTFVQSTNANLSACANRHVQFVTRSPSIFKRKSLNYNSWISSSLQTVAANCTVWRCCSDGRQRAPLDRQVRCQSCSRAYVSPSARYEDGKKEERHSTQHNKPLPPKVQRQSPQSSWKWGILDESENETETGNRRRMSAEGRGGGGSEAPSVSDSFSSLQKSNSVNRGAR